MPFRSPRARPRQVLALFISVVALVSFSRGTVRAAGSGTSQQDAGLSCKAILNAGLSIGNGIYWIDPNGGAKGDAFQAYCDMFTDGGGWTLAVNSVAGEEPVTNDMTSNTGTPGLDRGHTRNLANLAINNDAQIRYLLDTPSQTRKFHARFIGRYHNALPAFASWVPLSGHIPGSETMLSSNFTRNWSTTLSDRDSSQAACTSSNGGVPWHYSNCWTSIPTNQADGSTQGPLTDAGATALARFSIFVREVGSVLPQPTDVAPSFGLTANLAVGTGPVDAAIGDFDNDGKADIVMATSAGATVRYADGAVFLFPPGGQPPLIAVVAGQFGGDNRLDFVTVHSSGVFTTFVNTGSVTGGRSFFLRYFGGCATSAVVAGDFDGNGTNDLAFACPGSPGLSIAANDGFGSFVFANAISTNVPAHSLAAADFNGDSDVDLVVTGGSSGCFNVLLGAAGLDFDSNVQCTTSFMGSVAAGDWNNDGRPDIVVGASTLVNPLRNDDGTTFSSVGAFSVGSVVDVALADVDANGHLDLIVAHNTPAVGVGLGDGAGGFALSPPSGYGTSSVPRSVTPGDINGDGRPDFVTTDTATDSVSIFSNTFGLSGAPAASDGTLTVVEGTTETGTLSAVDPEGSALTFGLTSTGSKGTVTLTDPATGAYSYSANPGENGTDTFTFTASDGALASNTGTITVTITPKRTPWITWAPAGIVVYGTPLGPAQLNATTGVEGTFSYSPSAGTVLGAGIGQTLNVTFTPADSARYVSTSLSVPFEVLKAPLTVKTADASMVFSQPVPAFTVTYSGFVNGDSPASLGGTLTFTGPSSTNAGSYPITPGGLTSANYSLGFQAGTLTIARLSTRTSALTAMTDGGTVSALQPFKLTGAVSSAAAGLHHPTGQVRFFDNGTHIGTADIIATDYAVLTMSSVVPGPHAFTATYLGDDNFAPSTSEVITVTVRPLASSTFTLAFATNSPTALGQRATFAALVTALGGATTPTGTVAFFDGLTELGSAPLSGGVATFSTPALAAGPHVILAVYRGAGTHRSSVSSPTVHNVYNATPPLPAPMTLAASAMPTAVGQPLTFTVTVTPAGGAPTGTVLFLANNMLLGTATLTSAGGAFQAAVTTTALPVGVHVISAVYQGDGVFGASAAGPILHQVK